MMGGLDKRQLMKGRAEIDQELDRKVEPVAATGGYVPMVDHLVPPDVPWSNFCYYRDSLNSLVEGAG
jgi:hypothetical protein